MQLKRTSIINGYKFSTDKTLVDVDYVHKFLSEESYWAKGIPRTLVAKSIENSLVIGVYQDDLQIGFARLITDLATFGYLADVFIDKQHRGKGLSKNLMEFIFGFEELRLFRRMILATRDAHQLYSQYNFTPLKSPDRWMEFHQPDIYSRLL